MAKVTVAGTGDDVGDDAGAEDYFYKLHEVTFGFKRLSKIFFFFLESLISYVCQTNIIF